MRARRQLRLSRKGITPVISSIILAAAVISIGGAVWAYSQGASAATSKEYIDGVFGLMNQTIERFTVEHVGYNITTKILNVWVYNFGSIDVVVDAYANSSSHFISNSGNKIPSHQVSNVSLSLDIPSGSVVSIKVVSRRGNFAYNTFTVP